MPILSTSAMHVGAQHVAGAIYNGQSLLGPAPWSPARLFDGAVVGLWLDPGALHTMFQDAAGTIPVTDVGQPVGRMLDKSGNGNHVTQPTTTRRPILQFEGGRYYLDFDGVDDQLNVEANFSAASKLSIYAGLRHAKSLNGRLIQHGPYNTTGSYQMLVPANDASDRYRLRAHGINRMVDSAPQAAPPIKAVVTGQIDPVTGTRVFMRINGAVPAGLSFTGAGSVAESFFNGTLEIGASSSGAYQGRVYSLIIAGAIPALETVQAAETWVNAQTGAY